MISENKQIVVKHDENTDPITGSQSYAEATTSTGTGLAREENGSTITPQPDAQPTGSMNPTLARALMGGLIGVTLGTLAGVLGGKRTVKGMNHAVKGVGEAAKTVAEGVTQVAKGVGHGVKSVAEGVNQTARGALQDTSEGVNSVVVGALGAAKSTSEGVKPAVKGVEIVIKGAVEDAKQSVIDAGNAVKGTSENVKSSNGQNVKLAKERLVAPAPQVNPDQVSVVETQIADISAPVETEQFDLHPMYVNSETPVASGEANLHQGQSVEEIFEETKGNVHE